MNSLFSLKIAPVPSHPPFSFMAVISKKTARRAVDRNLLKRRLRHIIRKNKTKLPDGVRVTFFFRQPAIVAPFRELENAVLDSLHNV